MPAAKSGTKREEKLKWTMNGCLQDVRGRTIYKELRCSKINDEASRDDISMNLRI